jgi:hypothetical protein
MQMDFKRLARYLPRPVDRPQTAWEKRLDWILIIGLISIVVFLYFHEPLEADRSQEAGVRSEANHEGDNTDDQ